MDVLVDLWALLIKDNDCLKTVFMLHGQRWLIIMVMEGVVLMVRKNVMIVYHTKETCFPRQNKYRVLYFIQVLSPAFWKPSVDPPSRASVRQNVSNIDTPLLIESSSSSGLGMAVGLKTWCWIHPLTKSFTVYTGTVSAISHAKVIFSFSYNMNRLIPVLIWIRRLSRFR